MNMYTYTYTVLIVTNETPRRTHDTEMKIYHRLGTWQYKNDENFRTKHDLWPSDIILVWNHALWSQPQASLHGIKEGLNMFLGNLSLQYVSPQRVKIGCWRTMLNKLPTYRSSKNPRHVWAGIILLEHGKWSCLKQG